MKKIFLSVATIAAALVSQGQTLSPTVLSSGGGFSSNGGTSLSYTIGEMAAVTTVTGGSTTLTQGFQQPNDILLGIMEAEREAQGTFSVYPNPVVDNKMWFGYEFNETGKIEVSITNVIGQKLDYTMNETYSTGKIIHQLDCSQYASGNYLISAKHTNVSGQSNTISKKFQVVK